MISNWTDFLKMQPFVNQVSTDRIMSRSRSIQGLKRNQD